MILKFRTKDWFTLIISIFLLTDIAILLNIPFLRQILGFLSLTILPGLLILQILKLNKLELTEKVVLSVGLSVFFLMFFGLLINNLSFALGYKTPLSTIPLLISFNIILIALAIIGYKINKNSLFSLSSFNLNASEKAFLIVPILFPTLSIFGINLMNTKDNNFILMFLLFLIPTYIAFVCFFNQKFSKRLYPVVIFLISISLLLMVSLRSGHILGMDTHVEYYFFQTTLNNLHWSIFGHSTLDACLSISLLPTIYQSILNTNPEFLFKILHSLFFSVSPLAVFVISKKYMGSFYSFLASVFFMSQLLFLWTGSNARTNTAILFFALAIMALFHDDLIEFNRRVLFIIFAVSCIVSHYSTAYIFFFVLLLAWIVMQILPKLGTYKRLVNHIAETAPRVGALNCSKSLPKKRITMTIVILFFAAIFFWYSQVTIVAFNAGVNFVYRAFTNLNQFFMLESRGSGIIEVLGRDVLSIPQKMKFAVYWLALTYIVIGILGTIVQHKRMVLIPGLGNGKTGFLKSKIDTEYFIISLVCGAMLAFSVIFPYILIGYDMQRIYFMMMSILSMFFVIGGMTLARFLKLRPYWVVLVILLVLFLICTSSAVDQIFGVPGAVTLSSEGLQYNYLYVHDEESYAATWLYDNGELKDRCIYTDFTGDIRLVSQGGIYYDFIDRRYSLLDKNKTIQGYIYLRYYNVVNDKLFARNYEGYNIVEYQDKFIAKSKIYNNGSSEIWK